jgi:lysophospholipase L1-like esterase
VRNRVSIAIGLGAIAILLGVWTQTEGLPEFLSRAHHAVLALAGESGPPSTETNNAAGRQPVACPPAGDRTMVALVFGQSHAANVVKERFVGDAGVFNYFQGHCYEAVDPLLGTDHGGGNVWTVVGTELVRQQLFDAVILVTAGASGSYIGQWAPGGRLHGHLLEAAGSVAPQLSFTHVFIQQGESDLMAGTTSAVYSARFADVIAALRQHGIDAPIFVAIESGYCDGKATPPEPDNPIATAQKRLIAAHDNVYAGPDMDAALNAASDRYDGCHMSGAGARKLARLWTQAIATPARGSPVPGRSGP